MMPRVFILLPVHNRRSVTEQFVDCLTKQTYADYHLVVVDDGSTDGTAEMVKARIGHATLLKGRGDWWWAGSLQQGIDWLESTGVADQDVVLLANDDITFDADFIQKAVDILGRKPQTLLLPYLIDDQTGVPMESGIEADFRTFTFRPATSRERINCLPTRGLFMRMSDLRKAGGFHPRLLPHYWSDYEFSLRAARKGISLHTSPEITVQANDMTSGYRDYGNLRFTEFLKRFFSKKSLLNPIYSSVFILMAAPLRHIPFDLLKVWRRAARIILAQLYRSFSKKLGVMRTRRSVRRSMHDLRIIIGSAATRQEGWISTNYPVLDLTDEGSFSALFLQESVGNFLAEHVWEHLSLVDGEHAAWNCFRFLKKGGMLRIAVPDGFHPDQDYQDQVKPGGYGRGAAGHKVLYNHTTLSALLEKAGFETRLLEWFDEHGEFHHEDWDVDGGWVKRSTRFDPRNRSNPVKYTSLIIDAIKP